MEQRVLRVALTLSITISLAFAFGIARVFAYTPADVLFDQAGIVHWSTFAAMVGWGALVWTIATRRHLIALIAASAIAFGSGLGGLLLYRALADAPETAGFSLLVAAAGPTLSLISANVWARRRPRPAVWPGGTKHVGRGIVVALGATFVLLWLPRTLVSLADRTAAQLLDGAQLVSPTALQQRILQAYESGELEGTLTEYRMARLSPVLGDRAACHEAFLLNMVGEAAVDRQAPAVAIEAYEQCGATQCQLRLPGFPGTGPQPPLAKRCGEREALARRLKSVYPPGLVAPLLKHALSGEDGVVVVVTRTGVHLDHAKVATWDVESTSRVDARPVPRLGELLDARRAKGREEARLRRKSGLHKEPGWVLYAQRATPWIRVADVVHTAAEAGFGFATIPGEWLGLRSARLRVRAVEPDSLRALGKKEQDVALVLQVEPAGLVLAGRKLADRAQLYAGLAKATKADERPVLFVRITRSSLDFEGFTRVADLTALRLVEPLPKNDPDLTEARPAEDRFGAPSPLFAELRVLTGSISKARGTEGAPVP